MDIPIYQVDAFTEQRFSGNPAAVCPLNEWLPDAVLQAIATENNLSETAFFMPQGDGYALRWFTPGCEVDLCGHATLASAYVLFEELGAKKPALRFQTKSGELVVRRERGLLLMDFPSRPPLSTAVHPDLLGALGGEPLAVLAARDYLVRYRTEREVAELNPRFEQLLGIDKFAVIVTAAGNDCDFVSRFFAPAKGVPEDPVTGSAHCSLVPYWATELGKDTLQAKQISRRGGRLYCKLNGDRVEIGGHAAMFLRGTISV
jgi:predicted PhzF superfamily epimerase YddE/YHI9